MYESELINKVEEGKVYKRGGILDNKGNHVETVCLLSKLEAKRNIEVELKMSEMDSTVAVSRVRKE